MRKLDVGISLSCINQLDIILQNCIRQNHLDLIRSEEPTRAGVSTKAKCQAALVHAHKLMQRRLLSGPVVLGLLSELVKPQGVKFVGFGEDT